MTVLENPAPEARYCTQADFEACYTAVCGDRSQYQRRQDADYEALYDSIAFGPPATVRERLSVIIERQRQRNIKFATDLKSQIEAGAYSISTKDWDEFKWDNEAYKLFSDNIEWETDPAQPIDKKITYRLKGTEGKSPAFLEALKAYAREKLADFSDIRTLVENNLLSDEELRTTIRSLQTSLGDKVTPELKSRIESGKELGDVAFSLVVLRKNKISAYMCKSPECRTNMTRHLTQNLLPSLENFRKENANPLDLNSYLARCQSAFMQSAVRAPEFEAITNSLPALRERYLNTALAGMSTHSKTQFKKYLEEKVEYSTGIYQNPRTSLETSFVDSGRPYTSIRFMDSKSVMDHSRLNQTVSELTRWFTRAEKMAQQKLPVIRMEKITSTFLSLTAHIRI